MSNYHVSGNKREGYGAKQEGATRESAHFGTQREAEARAKELAANTGGGEVRIHGLDGKIRDSDTIPPGHDPNPPLDKKHQSMEPLLQNIRLKNHEISNAAGAKDYLVRVLKSKADNGLIPSPKDTFLTGSYRRGTKITPLNDVDVFYVIGHAETRDSTWHTITACDYSFGQNFLDSDNNISSIKILELIKGSLEASYPNSEIKRNNEVVSLYLDSYFLGLDIVPAFEIRNSNYYLIPNGSNSTRWKKSNPLTDEAIVNKLNDQHNQLVKDVIRITKHWFRKKRIVSPRPYHLEAATYHIFSNLSLPISSHNLGLTILLGNLGGYLQSCPDPTGLSEPLTSGLSQVDISNILSEAQTAINHLSIGDEDFIDYVQG